ncbi:LytR/AlgR family response regulator transcription factor [Corallococcus carmarthensis]|uniref:DNA-binding response regulator n=1 Tax=Corallococcus carmarthensis TaxID=2316728 RepID=A0A3A8K1T1_9BACT|nr:LytTR family DNA-binding domain-containing protein [Corallococcus carmarthensis]RKH01227.1 DNA-binding response regulator [Corallococcus carmarthensis]
MAFQEALFESAPIRVGVVDGESETLRHVLPLLDADADVRVAGVHDTGAAAVEALRREPVDVLFLDASLADMDGFQVLLDAGSACAGAVVFMTAREEHALRAFEAGALDYLLKPLAPERFVQVLGRAKEHVRLGRLQHLVRQLAGLVRTLPEPLRAPRYLDRLVIREVGRVTLLRVDDVDWMAAEDNYVQVHVGGHSHLLRQPLRELEARLDPERFVRIHRSTLVNLQRVQELRPLLHGEYQVILRDRTTLKLSRGYRERLGPLLAQG